MRATPSGEPKPRPSQPHSAKPRRTRDRPNVARDAHAAALLLGLEKPRPTRELSASDTMKMEEPHTDPFLDELIIAAQRDTSPGTLEAPDTLPG